MFITVHTVTETPHPDSLILHSSELLPEFSGKTSQTEEKGGKSLIVTDDSNGILSVIFAY